MTTIAPCPFCGYAEPVVDKIEDRLVDVKCPKCLAAGPRDATAIGATRLWNVRAPERLRNIKAESHDLLSQALNEGDGVYRP